MKLLFIRGGILIWLLITGISCAVSQSKKEASPNTSPLFFPPQPEQDCIHAIPLCNNSYIQQNSYSGQGIILNEINPLYSCLTTGEKNDVWYSFKVQTSGNLNFSITPINGTDDYDWAVFNLTNKSCSQIAIDTSLEVSCNFSANTGCGGVTGPNGLITGFCGQQNEQVISVTAGEMYVINVSNFSASQSGYSIDFSLSTAIIYDTIPPSGIPFTAGCTQGSLTLNFDEPIDCNSLSNPVTELKLVDATGFVYNIQSISVPGCNTTSGSSQFTVNLFAPVSKSIYVYLIALNGSDGNTFSDICGNFISLNDTVAQIKIQNDAWVNLGADISVCPDAVKPLLNAQNAGAAVYSWSYNNTPIPGNSQTMQTINAGLYGVQVIYGAGCQAKDSMQLLFLSQPVVNIGNDTTVCIEALLPLLNAGNAGAQYQWFYNGSSLPVNQQTYQPQQSGMYSVTVMGNCCSASDSMKIDFFPAINLQHVSDMFLCLGDTISFNATQQGIQQYNWYFDNNFYSSRPAIFIFNTGSYMLVVADDNSCSATDSFLVSEVTIPDAPRVSCPVNYGSYLEFAWGEVPFAGGYEISIDGGVSWQIPSSGSNGLTHQTELAVKEIYVRAISAGNCRAGNAAGSEQCNTEVSNIVTPNNDGKNDFFFIQNIELYPNTTVIVFNRHGKQVFKSVDYNNSWMPNELTAGTYFYIINYSDGRAGKGTLTVLK